ncbi:hypothetical protein IE4872_CH04118 [Rhizobium gallicum]|uniref:Uncharacterized protein n=1 Tax=Rhizobium gallicum TaxID=56730 RepID=A0A1L5NP84_9HYPH|nr:hypothetical protein [Rhizobium gallicum]APO69698.1 hypothetical protein IE4872_CH04118 [Rhizobium gallicum]
MFSVDAEEANFTDPLLDFTCLQLSTITLDDQALIDRTRNRRPFSENRLYCGKSPSVWPMSTNLEDDIFFKTYP